jgi:transposase-like protein
MTEKALITVKQQAALDSLLADGDQVKAARAAGVNDRTLRRWMHDPAFAAALQQAQDATLDAVTSDLVRAAGGAVALLRETVDNADAALGLRLQAARTLLDAALRWRELRGIERRLDALEQAINATPTTIDQVGTSR